VVLNGGLAPVLAQLELWLGLRDHDEDETALSGLRGGAVMLLDPLLRVTKSRNSLGGWDGILSDNKRKGTTIKVKRRDSE
jgi:hypothetical protein